VRILDALRADATVRSCLFLPGGLGRFRMGVMAEGRGVWLVMMIIGGR